MFLPLAPWKEGVMMEKGGGGGGEDDESITHVITCDD